jgi:hypothetical protein
LSDVTRQLEPLAEVGVRYVIIHKYRAGADEVSRWREWFVFQPTYEDEHLLVFSTTPRYGEDFQIATELGDGIGVMDAGVSAHEVGQGGSVDVQILWGTQDAPRRDWMVRLALVDSMGQEAQEADFEPFSNWPTSEWGQSAIVGNRLTFQVNPYIPGGAYSMTLSLVDSATGERLGESIALGQLDVQAMERVFEVPQVAVESEAVFGDDVRLLGYDLHQESDQLRVTLHWQALQRMDVDYKFFVHVVDPATEQLVAQADVMPRGWTYPTSWWEAGEVISDEITLSLTDVPSGNYRLYIGVYSDAGGRLLVNLGGDRYELEGEVTIKEP